MHDLVQVSARDGTWQHLVDEWKEECNKLEEDFSAYEAGAISVVRELAEGPGERSAGVFALRSDNRYLALCQLNSSYLPGYTGKVLRVRMMVLSPQFDFGEYPIEDYIEVITSLFHGVVRVSDDILQADHIKFHLRSPSDRQFFASLGSALRDKALFKSVAYRGSWLYISK